MFRPPPATILVTAAGCAAIAGTRIAARRRLRAIATQTAHGGLGRTGTARMDRRSADDATDTSELSPYATAVIRMPEVV